METIDLKSISHRINYRHFRITKVTDYDQQNRVLVEGFIRIKHGQRINLQGFIPYSVIGSHETVTDILNKLPVGKPSNQLSIFERNLLGAVAKTLVMSNSELTLFDIRKITLPTAKLVNLIIDNGFEDVAVSPKELVSTDNPFEEDVIDDITNDLELIGDADVDDSLESAITLEKSLEGEIAIHAHSQLGVMFYQITSHPPVVPKNNPVEYPVHDE